MCVVIRSCALYCGWPLLLIYSTVLDQELQEARAELQSKVSGLTKEVKPKKRERADEDHADVSSVEMAKT